MIDLTTIQPTEIPLPIEELMATKDRLKNRNKNLVIAIAVISTACVSLIIYINITTKAIKKTLSKISSTEEGVN